ncbi:MAG: hypothetical protein AAFY67_24750, partial [Cyanobacteria bacterium J06642_9]
KYWGKHFIIAPLRGSRQRVKAGNLSRRGDKRHPNEMGVPEIEAFLIHLAVKAHVAASTQISSFDSLP